eukprot:g2590.t1
MYLMQRIAFINNDKPILGRILTYNSSTKELTLEKWLTKEEKAEETIKILRTNSLLGGLRSQINEEEPHALFASHVLPGTKFQMCLQPKWTSWTPGQCAIFQNKKQCEEFVISNNILYGRGIYTAARVIAGKNIAAQCVYSASSGKATKALCETRTNKSAGSGLPAHILPPGRWVNGSCDDCVNPNFNGKSCQLIDNKIECENNAGHQGKWIAGVCHLLAPTKRENCPVPFESWTPGVCYNTGNSSSINGMSIEKGRCYDRTIFQKITALNGDKVKAETCSLGPAYGTKESCIGESNDGAVWKQYYGVKRDKQQENSIIHQTKKECHTNIWEPASVPEAKSEDECRSYGIVQRSFLRYRSDWPVEGRVVKSSCTHLVLTFTKAAPMNQGKYRAKLSVSGLTSTTFSDNVPRVATILSDGPVITNCDDCILSSDSARLTIFGRGFDSNVPEENSVQFRAVGRCIGSDGMTKDSIMTVEDCSGDDVADDDKGIFIKGTMKETEKGYIPLSSLKQQPRGRVIASTYSSITVEMDALSPQNAGLLEARVIVSYSPDAISRWTPITQVIPAAPQIDLLKTQEKAGIFSKDIGSKPWEVLWSTTEIAIFGKGFDASQPGNNQIQFWQRKDGGNPVRRFDSTSDIKITKSSMTHLVVSFLNGLYSAQVGLIYGQIRVRKQDKEDNGAECGPDDDFSTCYNPWTVRAKDATRTYKANDICSASAESWQSCKDKGTPKESGCCGTKVDDNCCDRHLFNIVIAFPELKAASFSGKEVKINSPSSEYLEIPTTIDRLTISGIGFNAQGGQLNEVFFFTEPKRHHLSCDADGDSIISTVEGEKCIPPYTTVNAYFLEEEGHNGSGFFQDTPGYGGTVTAGLIMAPPPDGSKRMEAIFDNLGWCNVKENTTITLQNAVLTTIGGQPMYASDSLILGSLVRSAVIIDSNADINLRSDSATVTIKGKGFERIGHLNDITFEPNSIKGTTIQSTRSQLVVRFEKLSPTLEGIIRVSIKSQCCDRGLNSDCTTTQSQCPISGEWTPYKSKTSVITEIISTTTTVSGDNTTSISIFTLQSRSTIGLVVGHFAELLCSSGQNSCDREVVEIIERDVNNNVNQIKVKRGQQKTEISNHMVGDVLQVIRSQSEEDSLGICRMAVVGTSTFLNGGPNSKVSIAKLVGVNPIINSNTVLLRLQSDSPKLTIKGKGFNSIEKNANHLQFKTINEATGQSQGATVKALIHQATLTMLVATFTHLSPTNQGRLDVGVLVSGTYQSSTMASVATIVPQRPKMIASQDILESTSLTLSIKGTGFDATTPGNNIVTLDPLSPAMNANKGGIPVSGAVRRSTTTLLVYSFDTLSPDNVGLLRASVTVSSTWSNSSGYLPIAKIRKADPSLIEIKNQLKSNSERITLYGRGFSAGSTYKHNRVRLITETIPKLEGQVERSTLTTLVVKFNQLRTSNVGPLKATIQVFTDEKFDTALTQESQEKIVSVIVEEVPIVYPAENLIISSCSNTMTIKGSGFDGTIASANRVSFTHSQAACSASKVEGVVEAATWTSLIVRFDQLSPTNHGPITGSAIVVHDRVSQKTQSEESSPQVVANVCIEAPTLTEAPNFQVGTSSYTVTMRGKCFDYVNPQVNQVKLLAGNPPVRARVITKPTRNMLVANFTKIATTNVGNLLASVEFKSTCIYEQAICKGFQNSLPQSSGRKLQTSSSPQSSFASTTVQIGTIIVTPPVVQSSTDLIKSTAERLSIVGFGFDLKRYRNNVALLPAAGPPTYPVVGEVIASTLTKLVYSFISLNPENGGAMLASVTVNNEQSVQNPVAQVIACPELYATQSSLQSDAYEMTIFGRGFYIPDPAQNIVSFESEYGECENAMVCEPKYYIDYNKPEEKNQHDLNATSSINNNLCTMISTEAQCSANDEVCKWISVPKKDVSTPPNCVKRGGTWKSRAEQVKAKTIAAAMHYIIVRFDDFSPQNLGKLYAKVQLNTKNDPMLRNRTEQEINFLGNLESKFCIVAVVLPTPATITENRDNVVSDSLELVIRGNGFDGTTIENSSIEFFNQQSSYPVKGKVMKSSRTHIVVHLFKLSAKNQGLLRASVTTKYGYKDNQTNGEVYSTSVIVGTVVPVESSIITSTKIVLSNSDSMMISGKGFDATFPEMNIVSFDNDKIRGIVSIASTTQLTYNFYQLDKKMSQSNNRIRVKIATPGTENLPNLQAFVQVGTIEPANVIVLPCQNLTKCSTNNTSTGFPINGHGFAHFNNSTLCNENNELDLFAPEGRPNVFATIVNCTRTQLIARYVKKPGKCNQGSQVNGRINDSNKAIVNFIAETKDVSFVQLTEMNETFTNQKSEITVYGCGFDQDNENNLIEIEANNFLEFPMRGYAKESSITKIVIGFSSISPENAGQIRMKIINKKANMSSQMIRIGILEKAPPLVTEDLNFLLPSWSPTLIIRGHGFNSLLPTIGNLVQFKPDDIKGAVQEATTTHLVVYFSTNLDKIVDKLFVSVGGSNSVQVATIVKAPPHIDQNKNRIHSDTTLLTITGNGFSINPKDNLVEFQVIPWNILQGFTLDNRMSEFKIKTQETSSSSVCQFRCDQESNCKAYQYIKIGKNYLLNGTTPPRCTFYSKTPVEANVVPYNLNDLQCNENCDKSFCMIKNGDKENQNCKNIEDAVCGYKPPLAKGNVIQSTLSSLVIQITSFSSMMEGILKMKLTTFGKSTNFVQIGSVAKVKQTLNLLRKEAEVGEEEKEVNPNLKFLPALTSRNVRLTLYGKGFDSTFPSYNMITFDETPRVHGRVIQSTLTHLIFQFLSLSPANAGELKCKIGHYVHTDLLSNTKTCATLLPESPLIDIKTSLPNITSNATNVEINGLGFDSLKPNNNKVELFPARNSTSILFTITKSSLTHLQLSFTKLSASNWGIVEAITSVKNSAGVWLPSAKASIAKIVSVSPLIFYSDDSLPTLKSDINLLNIKSSNFAFDESENANIVQFYIFNIAEARYDLDESLEVKVLHATRTNLKVYFTKLAPSNQGALFARIFVPCNPSHQTCDTKTGLVGTNFPTQVAQVVTAKPTLQSTTALLSSTSLYVTIKGSGFDSAVPSSNVIQITSEQNIGNGEISKKINGKIKEATRTSLIYQFFNLGLDHLGILHARLNVQDCGNVGNKKKGCSSVGEVRGDVSTVIPNSPFLYENKNNTIPTTAKAITIRGRGFRNNAKENRIIFSSDSGKNLTGTVEKSTTSTLKIYFDNLMPFQRKRAILNATVNLLNVTKPFSKSEERTISNLLSVDPKLDVIMKEKNIPILSSDSKTLTILGSGFDYENPQANQIIFSGNVTAHTEEAYTDRIIVAFDQLSTRHEGYLYAYATISSKLSNLTRVANIIPAAPTVKKENLMISSAAQVLTIKGSGFAALYKEDNLIDIKVNDRQLLFQNDHFLVENKTCTYNGTYVAASNHTVRVIEATRTELKLQLCQSKNALIKSSRTCSLEQSDVGKEIEIQVTTVGKALESKRLQLSSDKIVYGIITQSNACEQKWRNGHPCLARGFPVVDGNTCKCKCFCPNTHVDGTLLCQTVVPSFLHGLTNECLEKTEQKVFYGEQCEGILDEKQMTCYSECLANDKCNAAFVKFTRNSKRLFFDAVAFYNELKVNEDIQSNSFEVGRYFACMDSAHFLQTSTSLLEVSKKKRSIPVKSESSPKVRVDDSVIVFMSLLFLLFIVI